MYFSFLQVELSTPPGSPPNAVHKPVRMNAFELMASALDISAILDKQDTPSRTSTRFLSRCSPAVILGELETLATSKAWTPIRLEDSRQGLTALTSPDLSNFMMATQCVVLEICLCRLSASASVSPHVCCYLMSQLQHGGSSCLV